MHAVKPPEIINYPKRRTACVIIITQLLIKINEERYFTLKKALAPWQKYQLPNKEKDGFKDRVYEPKTVN